MNAAETWPVVDTHHHIGVSPTCTFIAEDALLPWMDEGGIDIQMVFQVNQGACHRTPDWNPYIGNDYVSKIQRMYPERVLGLATINPWLQPPRAYTHPLDRRGQPFDGFTRNLAIEECHRAIGELGLHGVKMHPKEHGYPVNHSVVLQILEELVRVQAQVKRRLLIAIHAAADSTYNTCEAVMDVCAKVPDLLFLMVHSGYIWGGKTLASTVGPLNNVLFDLTTCAERATVLEAYERYGVERFVAGTDGPFALPAVKHAIVESIFPTEDERRLVLGGNITKLLSLKRPPEGGRR
jgi:predicted TIM-barrel fold metal-dependent hydrolase